MSHIRRALAAIAVLLAAVTCGCSDDAGTGENRDSDSLTASRDEHDHDGGEHDREGGEHGRDGGEHDREGRSEHDRDGHGHHGEEGEESGAEFLTFRTPRSKFARGRELLHAATPQHFRLNALSRSGGIPM